MRNGSSRKKRVIVLLAVLVVCVPVVFFLLPNSGIFRKHIKEGAIEYKAEAVNEKDRNALTVPDGMTVKFKKDFSAAELSAGMGMAKMKFISDPVKKQFRSQVIFFGKQQSLMNMDEIRQTNYYFPDYEVEYGSKKKEIAGCSCKNAILKFKDGSAPLEVWYTKDIAINNPNWSNAYYKIDGVLMDYRLRKYGLELHFTATSVSEAHIDDSYFTIPAEFSMVKNVELEKMFSGFYQ